MPWSAISRERPTTQAARFRINPEVPPEKLKALDCHRLAAPAAQQRQMGGSFGNDADADASIVRLILANIGGGEKQKDKTRFHVSDSERRHGLSVGVPAWPNVGILSRDDASMVAVLLI